MGNDVTFTPGSRGRLADRVLWTPGERTEQISLADEASYNLAGRRQDGASEIISRANMPFVGRYRLELTDLGMGQHDSAYCEIDVKMPRTVACTAFSITSNVLTITAPAQHEVHVGQWIVVGGFAGLVAAGKGVALLVTAVTATTIVVGLTTANDSATEAGTVKFQPLGITQVDWVNIYDDITADETEIIIGTAQPGMYRVSQMNDALDDKSSLYYSDGTEGFIQTLDIAAEGAPVSQIDFDDADTAANTNLEIVAGVITLANNNAIATRITVDYRPSFWTGTDTNGFACFFEKNGELILKNRLGSAKEFAIENIGTFRANRVASEDPNPRIAELEGPIV